MTRISKIRDLLLGGFNRRAALVHSSLALAGLLTVGAANAQLFEDFVIRESTTNGPPDIQANTTYDPNGLEFIIAYGGQKAALGSSDMDGDTLGSIEKLSITRWDDETRFSAGSGPAVAPYLNFWITDGTHYAVVANEPSNPAFQPLFNNGYNLSWDDIKDKDAKVYENSDLTWLPAEGSSSNPAQPGRTNPSATKSYTFADLAAYMIMPPTAAELSAGWSGLGSGAPDELGTHRAWGVNWVFGDTLSSYVSGDPGYIVSDAFVCPGSGCVTPDVIFGTGNSNGNFTTDRQNGIELGLRAKIPYTGLINSNGDGTYSYTLAETGTPPNRKWNFDWTVNTDFEGSSGLLLDDLTYELGVDADPGLGVDFVSYDWITPTATFPCFDHSIGDNSTLNGGGAEANCGLAGADVAYANLLANNNVLQQSWRPQWAGVTTYDPDIPGTYAIYLLARNSAGTVVARTDIQVLIGGAPKAGPYLACVGFEPPMHHAELPPALGGGAIARRVKKNRVFPFKATLLDGAGNVVTDLNTPPVLVVYEDSAPSVSVDITDDSFNNGKRTDGIEFVLAGTKWTHNLASRGFGESDGTYTGTMESGDPSEYVIDPACEGLFVIEP